MIKYLLPALLLVLSVESFADNARERAKLTCADNRFDFEVVTTLEGEETKQWRESPGSTFHEDYDKQKLAHCQVGSQRVTFSYRLAGASPRGQCGYMPGAELTVFVNDMGVTRKVVVGNQCMTSLYFVSVESSEDRENAINLSLRYVSMGTASIPVEALNGEALDIPRVEQLLKLMGTAPFEEEGPSFDCSLARTGVEKLVCSNYILSVADTGLSQIYARLFGSLPEAERRELKAEQITWIKTVRDKYRTPEGSDKYELFF